MRINQNIMAMNAYRNLSGTDTALGKSLEKLSSGYRINRAADDAAGLVISQGLRAQISGLKQATRNAQDGISVVQTAEGALNEVQTMLNRMRDLAVQAANTATNDSNARTAAQAEVTQLKAEIDRITGSTKFGQQALLDGSFGVTDATATGFNATGTYTIAASTDFDIDVDGTGVVTASLSAGTYTGAQLAAHVQSAIQTALTGGSTAQQALANKVSVESTTVGAGFSLSIKAALGNTHTFALTDGTNTPLADLSLTGAVTAAAGTGGVFQVGANSGETIAVALASVNTSGLGISTIDISSDAAGAITLLDAAISTVSTTRGSLGAVQNRFESTIANLQVATENLSSSESRIRDTDMAAEMTNFTKQQILQQAGTAMLAQANSVPQSVLKLISG
jgi:flagellin